MKISKKDLRRIILENIISEQENRTGGGATRVRSDDREGLLTEIEKIVKDAAAANKDLVEAIIRVGKDFITFSGVIVKKGASEKEVKKAVRDAINKSEGIEELRRQLRRGRSYKVTINRSGEVQAAETTDQGRAANAPAPEGEPSPADDNDPKIYEYGDGYDYKVNQQTGCWMARKRPNGNWFSMKRYPENMWNLEKKFPEARTDAQKSKCPNRKPGSSGGSNVVGSTEVDKSALDAAFTEAEIRYIPEEGMPKNVHIYQGKYGDLKDFAEAMNATLPNYLKNAGDEQGFYLYYVADTNRVYLVDVAAFRSTGALPQFNLKQGFSVETRTIENREVDPTRDAGGFVKVISQLGSDNNVSESLSRGSLLRRRYWGRY